MAIPAICGCAHGGRGPEAGPASSARQRDDSNAAATSCQRCKKPGCPGCQDTIFSPKKVVKVAFAADLPPKTEAGECYAQVFVPPQFDKVTERVCVREKSEKIEVIPAEYELVEERVLVREASTQFVEAPAQFDVQDHVVQTSPGHSTWVKASPERCAAQTSSQDVYCLVSEPPSTMTLQTARLVNGATVKEVAIPAEYQIIQKQKLVRQANTRRVTVPAEYREIEKTVMVAPGRVEWQRVDCDSDALRTKPEFRPVRHDDP